MVYSGRRIRFFLLLVVAIVLLAPAADSYSVLSHEQIVDLAWKDHIVPALLHRYPGATPDELKVAHAYAYGGCVVQDMGYYPFGNHHFSDLVHYVRSGDFVTALLRESRNLSEYAFALGALAHYASDTMGHPAVNRSVPIEFPKLKRKYGDVVTYGQDHQAHIRTEFGFDVVQVAKNRYTSDAYHEFIGFAVAKESLARAFLDTYGFDIGEIFPDEERTIGSFRWAVGELIPKMTKVALATREKQIVKEYPSFERQKFLYHLSRSQYEHDWGKNYQRPGFGTRLLAFLIRLLPKIGPLKSLDIKNPTQETEQLYLASMNKSVELYNRLVDETAHGNVQFANKDFDTGRPTRPGEYRMCDDAYAFVVHKLAEHHFSGLKASLRSELLRFYASADPAPQFKKKKDREDWEKLQGELAELRAVPAGNPVSKSQP